MNKTSNAGLSLKFTNETVFPLVSGNVKSGAVVPRGSMVEGVNAMCGMWNGAQNFASDFGRDAAPRRPRTARRAVPTLTLSLFPDASAALIGSEHREEHCLFRPGNAKIRR